MKDSFSQAEMALRDTLLMKSDAKAFDKLAKEYGFPRPVWIPVENWRRGLQAVLHGPRGTLQTLRAFLYHVFMPWAVPFTWSAMAPMQTWFKDSTGAIGVRPVPQPFSTKSDYIPNGALDDAGPVWHDIDLSFREFWCRKIQDAFYSETVSYPATLNPDGSVKTFAKTVGTGFKWFKPSYLDDNGDWVDQTFLGPPKHPWKFHLGERAIKQNETLMLEGGDTGYHTGALSLIADDVNPADKISARYRAKYSQGDTGEGFLTPFVITERSGSIHNVGTSLLTKKNSPGEAAHVRIHLFLHLVPIALSNELMGTYVICGVPQEQPPEFYSDIQNPPVDPFEVAPPSGGERLEGQPWGGHLQKSEIEQGGVFADGPWPPYLTASDFADDVSSSQYHDSALEIAIKQLIPSGCTYEFIKGWGDGLPARYDEHISSGATAGNYVSKVIWNNDGYPKSVTGFGPALGSAEGAVDQEIPPEVIDGE